MTIEIQQSLLNQRHCCNTCCRNELAKGYAGSANPFSSMYNRLWGKLTALEQSFHWTMIIDVMSLQLGRNILHVQVPFPATGLWVGSIDHWPTSHPWPSSFSRASERFMEKTNEEWNKNNNAGHSSEGFQIPSKVIPRFCVVEGEWILWRLGMVMESCMNLPTHHAYRATSAGFASLPAYLPGLLDWHRYCPWERYSIYPESITRLSWIDRKKAMPISGSSPNARSRFLAIWQD